MNAKTKENQNRLLDRALCDARQKGMDEQTIAALRENATSGRVTVHQQESGEFVWCAA